MAAQSTNLFLIDELDDASRTSKLADSERNALRSVADWTRTFVAQPHKDLGRKGPVCPFTTVALDHKTLWFAPEHSSDLSTPDLIQLIKGYQRLLLAAQPVDGEDANIKSIVVVFTDLPADRAKDFLGGALQRISVPSYVEDGLVMGPFFAGNDGTAIYNSNFRPFTPPVPFLLIRRAVISDWKFFLNDADWLGRWGDRYGGAAVQALAEELRRQPWRVTSTTIPGAERSH